MIRGGCMTITATTDRGFTMRRDSYHGSIYVYIYICIYIYIYIE